MDKIDKEFKENWMKKKLDFPKGFTCFMFALPSCGMTSVIKNIIVSDSEKYVVSYLKEDKPDEKRSDIITLKELKN